MTGGQHTYCAVLKFAEKAAIAADILKAGKAAEEGAAIAQVGKEALEVAESAAKIGDGAQDAIKLAVEGSETVDDVKGVLDAASEVGIKSQDKVEQAKKLLSEYLGEGAKVNGTSLARSA